MSTHGHARRMPSASRAAAAFLGALLLASPVGTAVHGADSPESSTRLLVNLQVAENHGCSDDAGWFEGSSDFMARVWRNGVVVAETYKAQDRSPADWYGLHEFHVGALPATFAVEVLEAEPGGVLGLGTRWVSCDVSPAGGRWLNMTVDASGKAIVGTGDEAHAAAVKGYAAPTSASHPSPARLTLVDAAPTGLTFSWVADTAGPEGAAQTLQVRTRPSGSVPPGATSATVTGLQENTEYDVRLTRESGPWFVAHPWEGFRTANLPPPAPELSASAWHDAVNVTWHVEAHDLAHVEIHLGESADFTPSDATRVFRDDVHEFTRSAGTRTFGDLDSGATVHVVAVAVDDRGARTESRRLSATTLPPATGGDENAEDPSGDPAPAEGDGGQSPHPPAAPTAPWVTAEGGVTVVRWNVTNGSGVAFYHVRVAEGDGEFHFAAGSLVSEPRAVRLPDLVPGAAYRVLVRAVGSNGLTADSPAVQFVAPDPNRAPVARASLSATTLTLDERLVADAAEASDPDGDPLSYTWSWGDGSPDGRLPRMAHTYDEAGTYEVRLTVADPWGASFDAAAVVTVEGVEERSLTALDPSETGAPLDETPDADATGGGEERARDDPPVRDDPPRPAPAAPLLSAFAALAAAALCLASERRRR